MKQKNRNTIVKSIIIFGVSIVLSVNCWGQDSTSNNTKKHYRQFIAPGALISLGVFIQTNKGAFSKQKLQAEIQKNFATKTGLDDYTQYYSLAALATLKLIKQPSLSSTKDQLSILAKSLLITACISTPLKHFTKVRRPAGAAGNRSFPSGHAAIAFCTASILYKEYKNTQKIIAWSGYLFATATAMMRVMNDEHWVSDVLVGAGIGILSTEIAYLHQFRNKKKKNMRKERKSAFLVLPQLGIGSVGVCINITL